MDRWVAATVIMTVFALTAYWLLFQHAVPKQTAGLSALQRRQQQNGKLLNAIAGLLVKYGKDLPPDDRIRIRDAVSLSLYGGTADSTDPVMVLYAEPACEFLHTPSAEATIAYIAAEGQAVMDSAIAHAPKGYDAKYDNPYIFMTCMALALGLQRTSSPCHADADVLAFVAHKYGESNEEEKKKEPFVAAVHRFVRMRLGLD